MATMKYLKVRKDSDALAYQHHIGKRLKARARVMNISDPVVMPLSLKRGAPDTSIREIKQRFKEYRYDGPKFMKGCGETEMFVYDVLGLDIELTA